MNDSLSAPWLSFFYFSIFPSSSLFFFRGFEFRIFRAFLLMNSKFRKIFPEKVSIFFDAKNFRRFDGHALSRSRHILFLSEGVNSERLFRLSNFERKNAYAKIFFQNFRRFLHWFRNLMSDYEFYIKILFPSEKNNEKSKNLSEIRSVGDLDLVFPTLSVDMRQTSELVFEMIFVDFLAEFWLFLAGSKQYFETFDYAKWLK